jgi:DNA-binding CsgD family transcriptional regulator/general stress protein CsbA
MKLSIILSLKIGAITAGAILLYEIANLLLIYHYFNYDYYITGIGIIALIAGILLANKYHQHKQNGIDVNILEKLTAKELRVLELINEGKSNKEIAALNFIEVSTVKTHINNIYYKLGVKNRKDAAQACREHVAQQRSTLSPPL